MGQAGGTFYQRYEEHYQDLNTGNSKSNFARHLIENNLSMDRIQNIIIFVHIIA
jgi:hypothetical protein